MKACRFYPDFEEIPEGYVIPAGTISIVPHREGKSEPHFIPEGTIIMGGQELDRSLYPELSLSYAGIGGFYKFQLENLVQKFMLGFGFNGEIIRGTAVIYYRTVRWNDEEQGA